MSTNFYTISDLSEIIGLNKGTIRTYSGRFGISELFGDSGLLPKSNLIPFIEKLMPLLGYKPRKLINPETIKNAFARRMFVDSQKQYDIDNNPSKRELKHWLKQENEIILYYDNLEDIQKRLQGLGYNRTMYAIAKQKNRLTRKNV